MISTSEKLTLLRKALHEHGIDTFIIPSSGPHLGEDPPDHWQIIKWLTGFTGSAATVVITDSFAGLWTDSRYFLQAERQLAGSGIEFIRPEFNQRTDYLDFICINTPQGGSIGIDGRIFSVTEYRKLEKRIKNRKITVKPDCDLISALWIDRPLLPFSFAFDHNIKFSGKERQAKINEVRDEMRKRSADFHLLTSNDDIMWLLNIRGNDLKYSPLLLSYALVGEEQILLFIDENKIPVNLAAEFDKLGIVMLPYEDLSEITVPVTKRSAVLLNPGTTSINLYKSISKGSGIIEDISIPTRLKARKNKIEIENIGSIMIKDGVALTRLFFWFDSNFGKLRMTENSVSEKLIGFRSEQKDFLEASFATIVAFNENSALPHYKPEEGAEMEIGDRGLLLIDSGGQYLGGTSDITRTIPVGIPSVRQKKDFTLILKGHINLATAKFPHGTMGYQLDTLARSAMWESGLNYSHGTGHGVGLCLNVHEGPQSISPACNRTVIEPGMLTSNEPAIYRDGEYGIRTENLLLCYEDEETEFGKFLKFDTVSLCYIDKSLIDKSLLDQKEIDWLNSYHSEVYNKLSPYLAEEEKLWLRDKTDPL